MDGFTAEPALRDHWYVVASATQSTPAAVGLLGRAYVIWRDHDGVVRAAVDRCPHREAPLSAGTLVEGHLECAYHGWRFTDDGTCAAVPSSGPDGPVPPAARLDIVAAAERYGLVWVCPGEPSAPIPEMRWDDDDRFRRINTEVDVWRTSATRMTDNFLDTTSYFSFVVWRNDDPATDPQAAIAFDRAIGAEDKAMLERIDGVLPLDPAAVVNVRADTGSVEWRRRLSNLLAGHPDGGSP